MFVDMLFILKAPAHAKFSEICSFIRKRVYVIYKISCFLFLTKNIAALGSRSWVVHFLLSRVRPFRKYVQINGK